MTEKIDATNLPGRKRSEEILPRTPQHETEGSLPLPHEVAPPDYRLHRQDERASDPVIPAEIVGLGDNYGALAPRKSVVPGHNLDESDLMVGVPGHGCSACCSKHNNCHECHERPFPSGNVHLNFHYFVSCSHRSFFHPEPEEFAADCTCECGCQCGNCRRSRESIYTIVQPPLGAWSLTFAVRNESLSFQSGEPIFLVEFESVETTPENQWSIEIEGSVDELNGPLIPVEFEMPDELRVMLEAEMRTAIRNACQRLMAKMTAEVAEATAQPDAGARTREAE